jgi:hypothetical protein
MTTTFQKRSKEMKRLEKQRAKAERRAQRKLAKRAENDASQQNAGESVQGLAPVKPDSQEIPS